MEDFQKLINFENLYASYTVSMRGKGKKKSAIQFSVLALENLYRMKRQLIEHTYEISKYSQFIISEPKKRLITSGAFRDKVLQHCLCDYVLLPKMKDIFLLDNYAEDVKASTKNNVYDELCAIENLVKFCEGMVNQ